MSTNNGRPLISWPTGLGALIALLVLILVLLLVVLNQTAQIADPGHLALFIGLLALSRLV